MSRKNFQMFAIFLTFALLSHFAFVYACPYGIVLLNYFANKGEVKVNEAYHAKPVDANFKKVVMPSPDILYSACVYKISESDLLIEADVPDFTYWSVSFYSINTDNFYTINDMAIRGHVRLVLTKNGSCSGDFCVHAPSDRGIVIFRMFIPDNSLIPDLLEFQKSIRCQVFE